MPPIVLLEAAAGAVAGLLARSDLLSHITRRLVTDYGNQDSQDEPVTVTIVLEPPASPVSHTFADRMLSPPPSKLLLLNNGGPNTVPLLGMVLSAEPNAGHVTWIRSRFAVPTVIDAPSNLVAVVLAVVVRGIDADHMRPAEVSACGSVDGYQVVTLA